MYRRRRFNACWFCLALFSTMLYIIYKEGELNTVTNSIAMFSLPAVIVVALSLGVIASACLYKIYVGTWLSQAESHFIDLRLYTQMHLDREDEVFKNAILQTLQGKKVS